MSSIARDNFPEWVVPLLAAAVFAAVSGCHTPGPAGADVIAAEKPAPAPTPANAPPATGAKESARAPVQPTPVESRTPEEAAKRAADPKDPSGALIIEPPAKAAR